MRRNTNVAITAAVACFAVVTLILVSRGNWLAATPKNQEVDTALTTLEEPSAVALTVNGISTSVESLMGLRDIILEEDSTLSPIQACEQAIVRIIRNSVYHELAINKAVPTGNIENTVMELQTAEASDAEYGTQVADAEFTREKVDDLRRELLSGAVRTALVNRDLAQGMPPVSETEVAATAIAKPAQAFVSAITIEASSYAEAETIEEDLIALRRQATQDGDFGGAFMSYAAARRGLSVSSPELTLSATYTSTQTLPDVLQFILESNSVPPGMGVFERQDGTAVVFMITGREDPQPSEEILHVTGTEAADSQRNAFITAALDELVTEAVVERMVSCESLP